jgi:subtilase family serine protease
LKTALLCASVLCGFATAASAAPLITAAIDDTLTVPVVHEASPLLAHVQDHGVLADTVPLNHIMLVLKRSPEMQAAFDTLVRDQLDRSSPLYRQWLKPTDLRRYGPDEADIAKVVAWLQGHGLTVNSVSPSGMSIDFAGKPSAVAAAFHTSLHNVSLPNGEAHIANMTDLAIPAALAPVVHGATLSNFFPKPNMTRFHTTAKATGAAKANPNFDVSGTPYTAIGPADYAIIYNMNPLFNGTSSIGKRVAGAGVTVAVLERTDILAADWHTFRAAFGLSGAAGVLKSSHPGAVCTDPGTNGDEGEAALDAEWSSAAAPDATIIETSCGDDNLTFGVETALQEVVEHGTTASVLTVSYGQNEKEASASFLAGWANLVEEAASQGLSVMVSTGDSGDSSARGGIAEYGLDVNGLSTNPYLTAVGGTDFYDGALGKTSEYFRPNNVRYYSSAKSYVPEIPWDNSCSGEIVRKFFGYPSAIASCNDPDNPGNYQDGVGGSGGESGVYTKPNFQAGVPGMPADGMRDNPDVSLFASNGFWGHFLVLCMSDPNEGGTTCDYSVTDDVFGNAAGGTSFAAPTFGGIAALIVQQTGGRIGNPAPRLYELARTQFTSSPLAAACNATLGKRSATSCVFHDVEAGNIAEPCFATTKDCFSTNKSLTYGLGTLRNADAPSVDAYPAQPGYSLATGLGSVNVTNLVTSY